jgi:hypothetical protein
LLVQYYFSFFLSLANKICLSVWKALRLETPSLSNCELLPRYIYVI